MLVSSVDYANRRIYLSAATADTDLDTMDVYREVRTLRRTNEDHRKYRPMIIGGGNIEKIPDLTYTAPYVQLLYGCRIVPYNVTHGLRLIRDTFTDDGFAGRNCFDRTPLSPTVEVDIDVEVDAVEVRQVTIMSGSGLSVEQDEILRYVASTSSTAALEAAKARQMQTNRAVISGDELTVTIYADDGTTPLHLFDISADKKSRTPQ